MNFRDKVVVVTGAGRNLGRAYALAFAARGARVVVNDLGVAISDTEDVSLTGDASQPNPADDVVAEIRAVGGAATANYDSIATPEGGRGIIESALQAFGAVDVLVNNAGQVRLAPFEDFPESSLDTLIDTQLRGTVNVSRPAWKWMKSHGGGRIVNVSSGAAFGGVPDGTMYAMAKMGLIGLTRAMAGEGADHGISVNVIVPYAKTRAGTNFGPIPWSDELGEWLAPEQVAPLVLYLSHESCELNGEILSVGAGWFAGMSISLARGWSDRHATPETIAERIETIMNSESRRITPLASPAVKYLMQGYTGSTSRDSVHRGSKP